MGGVQLLNFIFYIRNHLQLNLFADDSSIS